MGRTSALRRDKSKPPRPGNKSKRTSKGVPKKSLHREYTEAIIFAFIAAYIIKTFFIQAFRIPTASMEDSLLVGDFLLVNKFIYGAHVPFTDWRLPAVREPEAGDIIVFQYPRNPEDDYIKRCVAVEGQRIEVRNKILYVDGKPQPLPPNGKIGTEAKTLDNYGPMTVPDGHVFMMGDNRDNSSDSRFWGPLDKRLIRGEAFILYMSWQFYLGDPELIWTLDQPLTSIVSVVHVGVYHLVRFPWRIRWDRVGMLIE